MVILPFLIHIANLCLLVCTENPTLQKRLDFCHHFKRVHGQVTLAWLCLVNLNQVAHEGDKQEGV